MNSLSTIVDKNEFTKLCIWGVICDPLRNGYLKLIFYFCCLNENGVYRLIGDGIIGDMAFGAGMNFLKEVLPGVGFEV